MKLIITTFIYVIILIISAHFGTILGMKKRLEVFANKNKIENLQNIFKSGISIRNVK
jgi:hypothetical protein